MEKIAIIRLPREGNKKQNNTTKNITNESLIIGKQIRVET